MKTHKNSIQITNLIKKWIAMDGLVTTQILKSVFGSNGVFRDNLTRLIETLIDQNVELLKLTPTYGLSWLKNDPLLSVQDLKVVGSLDLLIFQETKILLTKASIEFMRMQCIGLIISSCWKKSRRINKKLSSCTFLLKSTWSEFWSTISQEIISPAFRKFEKDLYVSRDLETARKGTSSLVSVICEASFLAQHMNYAKVIILSFIKNLIHFRNKVA